MVDQEKMPISLSDNAFFQPSKTKLVLSIYISISDPLIVIGDWTLLGCPLMYFEASEREP